MLTSNCGDASEVAPGIYVGGCPDIGCRAYDVIVLAAKEYQPASESFPGVKVIHVPMDDADPMSNEAARTAIRTAMAVATLRRKGNKILVSCWAGLNRSGLIAALAIKLLYKVNTTQAISVIRNARGSFALNNPAFVRLIGAFSND